MDDTKLLDGPIPGENFTSDTRNYPWHRPPEFTDLDPALEDCIKKLTEYRSAVALLTMLQSGVTVVNATIIFLLSGIGKGKFSVDIALLLAGPISHMIKLMADGYGIKYEMGMDDSKLSTISFIEAKAKINPKKAVSAAEDVEAQLNMFKNKAHQQPIPEDSVEETPSSPTTQEAATPPDSSGGFMGMAGPLTPPQQGN